MSNVNPQWTQYNNNNNEGGEGYNPYSKHLDHSGEPEWSILEGRASRLQRICNGTSFDDARYAGLKAQSEAANAAYAEEFARALAAGEA